MNEISTKIGNIFSLVNFFASRNTVNMETLKYYTEDVKKNYAKYLNYLKIKTLQIAKIPVSSFMRGITKSIELPEEDNHPFAKYEIVTILSVFLTLCSLSFISSIIFSSVALHVILHFISNEIITFFVCIVRTYRDNEDNLDDLADKMQKISPVKLVKTVSLTDIRKSAEIKEKVETLKIPSLISSRIVFYTLYVILPYVADFEEILFFPLNILLLSWIYSVWIFDPFMAVQGQDFSKRTTYFRDRFFYFAGYGIIPGIMLYSFFLMEITTSPLILFILTMHHCIALYSRSVVKRDKNCPKYSRWLPHQKSKISLDMDEYFEYISNLIVLRTVDYFFIQENDKPAKVNTVEISTPTEDNVSTGEENLLESKMTEDEIHPESHDDIVEEEKLTPEMKETNDEEETGDLDEISDLSDEDEAQEGLIIGRRIVGKKVDTKTLKSPLPSIDESEIKDESDSD